MSRTCAACGYPTGTWELCAWCWETLAAGSAARVWGSQPPRGVTDRALAMLAAEFVARAVAERAAW